MSIISRPVKTGGTTTYLDEVASGNTHIKAAEVDDDFNTIYLDYNGNITNANIAPAANIATAKLAQDGGIQTGHLADNSVTSAKIADGTITADDLAPDSVTATKILDGAIGIAKLSPGASVRHAQILTNEVSTVLGAAEATFFTFTTFTPAGAASLVALHVSFNGNVAGVGATDLRIRIKRNGTTYYTATTSVSISGTDQQALNVTIPALFAFLTGTQDFTITTELVAAAGTVTITSAYAYVLEHA